jgi:hypothetical protein
VESAQSIDLAYLRRRGMLSLGHCSSLTWSRWGQSRSISVNAEANGLRLRYRIINCYGVRIQVDELVPFTYSATCFGGQRQWFKCLKCGRRCRKLYGGQYFRCRQCHGLVHASTREPAYQRALDQADRLWRRLGGSGSAMDSDEFPQKPPGMHWRTYRRLAAKYEELLNRWAFGAAGRIVRPDE